MLPKAREIAASLRQSGVRVMLDDREEYKPGWKFSEWEMRGVPLRLEIGPKDIEKSQVVLVRRDNRVKAPTPMDCLTDEVKVMLETIQAELFDRAVAFREQHTRRVASKDEFVGLFVGRPGYVVSPWCGGESCEAKIKEETQATIRNLPLLPEPASGVCIECGEPGRTDAYFAKAY